MLHLRLSSPRARRPCPRVVRPQLEALEDRLTPAIHFTFAYLGDAATFFAPGTDARNALEFAGNTLLGPRIATHLAAIQPDATNHWTAKFYDASAADPQNQPISKPDLAVGENEVVVFVMMNDSLRGGVNWNGYFDPPGPGSTTAWLHAIEGRGNPAAEGDNPTAVAPWGGVIAFTHTPKFTKPDGTLVTTTWSFEQDPSRIPATAADFVTTAEHELGHILGFVFNRNPNDRTAVWDRLRDPANPNLFTGKNAEAAFGGKPVPLDPSFPGHWADLKTLGRRAAMQEVSLANLTRGELHRVTFTDLDFAALQDIGWRVPNVIQNVRGDIFSSALLGEPFVAEPALPLWLPAVASFDSLDPLSQGDHYVDRNLGGGHFVRQLVEGDYRATIDWGDGSQSKGYVFANGAGGFDVLGNHTYAKPFFFLKPYHVHVHIRDIRLGAFADTNTTIIATSSGRGIMPLIGFIGAHSRTHQGYQVTADGVLQVNGDQLADKNDTITIAASGSSLLVDLNGELSQFDRAGLTGVEVRPGAGHDTINVEGAGGLPLTVFTGTVSSTVNITPRSHSLAGLGGDVTIHGGTGLTSLVVDDQAAPGAGSYSLTGATIQRDSAGVVRYDGVSAVTLHGGQGDENYLVHDTTGDTTITTSSATSLGSTVTVLGTTAPLQVTGVAGTTHVLVGAGTVGNVRGQVSVSAASGAHVSLTVDDSADANPPQAVTLSSVVRFITRPFLGVQRIQSSLISGLAPAPIVFSGDAVPLTVKAGGSLANNAGGSWTVSGTGRANKVLDLRGGTTRVLGTTGSLAVVGVGGTSAVVVGGGTLQSVVGRVSVGSAGGAVSLTLDDSADTRATTWIVYSRAVQHNAQAALAYTGVQSLTVKGGGGKNTFHVISTSAATPVVLDAGHGSNTYTLGNTFVGNSHVLDLIQGPVSIQGFDGAGSAAVSVIDSGSKSGHTYTLSPNTLTRPGVAPITFVNVQNVAITAGSGNDTLADTAAPGTPVTFDGGSGTNTVAGPNAASTWTLTGSNAGSVAGLTFSAVASLTGGASADVFQFGTRGVSGTIDGGGGVNTLDYSAFPGNILVDLPLGRATLVGGGARHIQDVIGGSGNAILVGDGSGNTLTGGKGRNLLIAGPGPATLIGGGDQDILVGGTTAYDAKVAALNALMAEWSRTALPYATRVNHLLHGGGLNGATLLNGSTFHANGGSNTLTGGAGLDLFYGSHARDSSDWNADLGEVFVEDRVLPSITIATRGLSVQGLVLDGQQQLPASGTTLLELAAGPHTLADAGNPAASVQFTVAAGGAISYDPSLEGALSGAGTSTLTVNGVTVTIDTTRLSTTRLALDTYVVVRNTAPFAFTGLPGLLTLSDNTGSGATIQFTLKPDGTVSYDASLEGALTGAGTSTLTVHGETIQIDATALSRRNIASFQIVGAGSFSTAQVQTVTLLPGPAIFQDDTLQFVFTITLTDTVDFDHALDGQVGGRGTRRLVLL
jgi:hypothetical protein